MELSNDLRKGRNCAFLLHIHLVFITRYRRTVFTKQILNDLSLIFNNVCIDFEAHLKEFNGEGDHVHLLIEYPPKVSVSKLVNSLKGVSSRLIRKKGYKEIQKALWGESLWSPSYFAGSCGGAPLGLIQKFIEDQNTPMH
jgi:putative transposase